MCEADAPHTYPFSPDNYNCQFPGGVWANYLYIPLSITYLLPLTLD
jgi:hypothetical protein